MYKIILFLSILSLNAYADKVAVKGELISADKINSSVAQIGDIKQSLLNTTQFQSLHGDCWRLMDGESLMGTDLGALTGMANLPDMVNQGSTLKQVKGSRVLGSYESDEVKAHNHAVNDPGHRHIEGTSAVNGNLRYGYTDAPLSNRRSESGSSTTFASFTQTVATGVSVQSFGAEENRVKNTGVNFFIKVNKECSF